MSLQVDYRPKSFKTFVGNEDAIESLKAVLDRETPPSAFLFTGPAGTGKTTLARIVKNALKCANADFKEINASDDRGIDGVRKIIEGMRFTPLAGARKVILLDEAHMLTKPSQEALLKALEEPPPYVNFCICTTNPESLKIAFRRRCHQYGLQPLKDAHILKLIKRVLTKERVADYPQKIIEKIVELSDGSAGIALKLLDQVIDFTDPAKAISALQSSGAGESEVIDICRALINSEISDKARWARVKKLLSSLSSDGETARRPILGYMSKCLLGSHDVENGMFICDMMAHFSENFYDSGRAGLEMACFLACHGGE